MKLQYRATRPDDLEQCLALVTDRFLYDEIALRALRAMWLDIIARDVGRSSIIFEDGRPLRVLAFGISVAIERSRFAAIDAGCAPFIARRLLEEWRAGQSAFLDEDAFAAANAGDGINLFVTHSGALETTDPLLGSAILSAVAEAFIGHHTGLNIAAFAHETFGLPKEFAADLGLNIRLEYPAHEDSIAKIPPQRQPILATMTRSQAEKRPGNLTLHQIFLRFTPPLFGLAANERRLLRFALEGEADAEIAEILTIAPATLKKRWARIYETMEPVIGGSARGDDGRRGAEARRHVLRYVRQHPEELHPCRVRTAAATATSSLSVNM